MNFTIFFSIVAGVLGRLGGKKGFDTKWRDIGVSLCICIILGFVSWGNLGLKQWLAIIATFGLQWAALTSYHYFLPKPDDYKWYHYALHGFMISLAALLFAWSVGSWIGFGIRCVVNAILCGVWYFVGVINDDLHEFGRYFLITVTTPLI